MPSRRHVAPALAAAGLASLLVCPRAARAQDSASFASTFFVSVSVGDKAPIVGLGADFRMSGLVHGNNEGCSRDSRIGFGPFAQATWLIPRGLRIAVGGHGGGEILTSNQSFGSSSPSDGVDGELGWTWRSRIGEAPGGHGLHLGLQNLVFPASFAVRGALSSFDTRFVPEATFALGAGYPQLFGPRGECIVNGRPLRDGDALILPPLLALGPAPVKRRSVDAGARRALAAIWGHDAQTECASVPAFLALARDLRRAGAPADLEARALASAVDEVRHTHLCASLSASFSGLSVAPALLDAPDATDASRADALLRLALESLDDGCIGEGAASLRAARGARDADDDDVRAALTIIAADEARHAQLGFDVLSFCLDAGGARVRDAVAASLRQHRDSAGDLALEASLDHLEHAGRAGRVTADAAAACHEEATGLATRRIEAIL
jgi:hypothetical protein